MIDFTSLAYRDWIKNPPATSDSVLRAEVSLGQKLPDDYKEFLAWSNGGEGKIKSGYLSLWSVEKLEKLNADYEIGKWLPNFFGIGTDGGSLCFGFYPHTKAALNICSVPLGDLCFESVSRKAESFSRFLEQEFPL